MGKIEWYHDFIDLRYKPKKTDLKVLFYFEPDNGITKEDAMGRIASESSTGTWTTLFKMPPRMKVHDDSVSLSKMIKRALGAIPCPLDFSA